MRFPASSASPSARRRTATLTRVVVPPRSPASSCRRRPSPRTPTSSSRSCRDGAKTSAPFPKNLVTSAVDAFGEPRTYKLAKPARVCAPATGDLGESLVCYAAKAVGNSCVGAPANAARVCEADPGCGGMKKVTSFCRKSSKHAARVPFVFATTLARDRAGSTKPIELYLPSALAPR